MHEVALVSAALAQAIDAARRAGAARVQCLTFALQSGGHVSRDAVETLVAVLAQGTPVEGAQIAFETAPRSTGSADLVLTSIDVETPSLTAEQPGADRASGPPA
jgi:Zn finger protein HypA/HybF involved in hydrogenase expression